MVKKIKKHFIVKTVEIPGGNRKEYDNIRSKLYNRGVEFIQTPKRWHWQNPSYKFSFQSFYQWEIAQKVFKEELYWVV